MLIPSGIGIIYPNQFHFMGAADLLLFSVPRPYIFNGKPLSLMNGLKQISVDRIQKPRPLSLTHLFQNSTAAPETQSAILSPMALFFFASIIILQK